MRFFYFLLFLSTISLYSDEECNEANSRKSKAILIGINNYGLFVKEKNSEKVFNLGNLTESIRDVKTLSQALKDLPKMEIIEMTSDLMPESPNFPSKENIEKQLEGTADYDFVILFFSGHGKNSVIYSSDISGEIEKEDIEIPVEFIYKTLNAKNVKNAIVIIDACRDQGEVDFIGFAPISNHNYKSLYSTSFAQYSSEEFRVSKYLSDGLTGRYGSEKGKITSNFLFGEVIKRIKKESYLSQKPLDPASHSIPILIKCNVENNSHIPLYAWTPSILFPGAGQYNKGHKLKSASFFFLNIALGANSYFNHERYRNAKEEHNVIRSSIYIAPEQTGLLLYPFLEKEKRIANSSAENQEVTSLFFAVMYLTNVYDAFFSEKDLEWTKNNHSLGFHVNYSVSRQFSNQPEQTWTLSYQWNFK